jgi:hypothetical protein
MSKFVPQESSTKLSNLTATKPTKPTTPKPSDKKSFSKNPFQGKTPKVIGPHPSQRISVTKSTATPVKTQLRTLKMSSHGQLRSEIQNEMNLNVDGKLVTQSVKRPLCFRFAERFSERRTLKQSNFWKQLGSGVENAADALIFKTNDLKVSGRISGGKSCLERAIIKARNRKLLIEKKIWVTYQRFRNYLNVLRRNPRIIQWMQIKRLPNDSSTLRSVTDPVEDQNWLSEEESAEFRYDWLEVNGREQIEYLSILSLSK